MCFLPVTEATTTAPPARLPLSSHGRHPIAQWLLLNGHPWGESHQDSLLGWWPQGVLNRALAKQGSKCRWAQVDSTTLTSQSPEGSLAVTLGGLEVDRRPDL